MLKQKTTMKNCIVMAVALSMTFIMTIFNASVLQAKTTLKMQSMYASGGGIYNWAYEPFANYVKEKSDGELIVKVYEPGSILSTSRLYDGLKQNVVDIAGGSPAYYSSKISAVSVEAGFPFSFTSIDQADKYLYEYKNGKAIKMLKQSYEKDGVVLLGSVMLPCTIYSNEKLENPSDFKGVKIRSVRHTNELFKNMGASPTVVSGSEVYMAMQRGVIDAFTFGFYTIDTYNFYEVADKYYVPAVYPQGQHIIMNKKSYDKLSKEHQEIIKEAGEQALRVDYKQSMESEKKRMREFALSKKDYIEYIKYTDEQFNRFREIAYPLWDKLVVDTEMTKEYMKMLKEYLGNQ